MSETFKVEPQSVPNPESMKFVVNQAIAPTSLNIDDPLKAHRSPLAQKLFGFPWTEAVFIGTDFVTLTKQEWVEWDLITEPLSQLIQEHLELGEPVLIPAGSTPEKNMEEDSTMIKEGDSPVVVQIKEVLNAEIRPAVAMDGGDVAFHKYEQGIVYLRMQGACSGCPSAAMTLKMGIETRLKAAVSEIKEVVAVDE